ncbi:MAG TPA: hypothetical protein VH107_11420 [Lacipirellulaceae bacterium]|nr:hypothetical protein [Lacipirellulaceae bacterium]
MVATLVTAIILAPFAFQQFGVSGLIVVLSFAFSMIVSVLATSWGTAKLAQNHDQVAKLFTSSGVRMVAPLIIAVVVVAARGRLAPVESVYYVLPLYLCMLIVDVAAWVRDVKAPNGLGRMPCPSVASGEDI